MKIALIHDYLSEFGGAERVLKVLSEMYPRAPIYTAFVVSGSQTEKEFKHKDIRESFLAPILRIGKLYSPLRFLAPVVWRSFDLSEYDLVIASSSWFITRGFRVGNNTKVVCYCHTPPRYLYGYETSVNLTKYWPVRVYASLVNHFLRMYDFWSAQTIDRFIANSENVKKRIFKFYRKDSVVVYPPVAVSEIMKATKNTKKDDFFLIVSRLVGGKGIEEAAEAAARLGFKLKIAGEAAGFSKVAQRIAKMRNVELLGRVEDEELYQLYAKAKGFIALARNEDFGMTVVEAQAAGTPVIAYDGGGFRESVVDPSSSNSSGQAATGILVDDTETETLEKAFKKFDRTDWDRKEIQENARRFSRENFEREIKRVVEKI